MTLIVKELRKALVEAGASEDSADAAAMAVISVDTAAGKQDLAELRHDMETGFAELRREMETGFADVRREMAELKVHLMAFQLAIGGLIVAVLKFL